jgi:XTP/dITP diphosphohydrolase
VDALDGRPGILSARYGLHDGVMLATAERNERLLTEIGGATNRSARFICSMVLLIDEHQFFSAQQTLEGEIIAAGSGRGAGGFGYDPLLYLPSFGRTVAELPVEIKNRVSHRGQAARALAGFLERLE